MLPPMARMDDGQGTQIGSGEQELRQLRQELIVAREKERELRDTRRAVINLLEDLDDDRARLARAEQEWRAAFDGIRDAVFLHDSEGRIIRANHAYLALARCTAEEATGHRYPDVFPDRALPFEDCGADSSESEFTANGMVFRARCYVVTAPSGEFAFTVRVLEDITSRRHTERELHSRTEELAESNRALERSLAELRTAEGALIRTERLAAIGTLASGVAHELNNPLMGVLNYVEFARERMEDAKAREMLARAERELHRMEGFVFNLLRLGRPSDEKLAPVAVKEPLERALDLLAADFHKNLVQVVQELPTGLNAVWASSAALQQVFLNLLLNAVDAMAGSTEKCIRITAWEADGKVVVKVSDTGVGVTKEVQARLFEPFFTTKPEGQGTGLGLSISRRIMSGFGGALDYEAKPSRGATFLLTLRVASAE